MDTPTIPEPAGVPVPGDLAAEAPISAGFHPLEALAALLQALEAAGVRCCHWKSNLRLEKSLLGRTDLDLLVDPSQAEPFRRILAEHQVIRLNAAPGRDYPGIENYLGFDPASGRLFHLHVHYRLVLGEQFVKNYHLPLEAHFLEDTQVRCGVRVPRPELELAVLCIRALLKYRDRDALKDLLGIRSPGLPEHVRAEIDDLLMRTTPQSRAACLDELDGLLPTGLVREFLAAYASSPRPGLRFFRLRGRLRRALRGRRRTSPALATLVYFREAWRRRKRFRGAPVPRKMTLPGASLTLALVGIDGAGKSTHSRELARWLGWKLDARPVYLGSKHPSRRSRLVYLLYRAVRRSRTGLGRFPLLPSALNSLQEALLDAHDLSIAYDRLGAWQRGQRLARQGSLVIYDRFPFPALQPGLRRPGMDGPKIRQRIHGRPGFLRRTFAAREEAVYARLQRPHALLALSVTPGEALRRKPDHDPQAILAKYRSLEGLLGGLRYDHNGMGLYFIDAEGPVESVARQLKSCVWKLLAASSPDPEVGGRAGQG